MALLTAFNETSEYYTRALYLVNYTKYLEVEVVSSRSDIILYHT